MFKFYSWCFGLVMMFSCASDNKSNNSAQHVDSQETISTPIKSAPEVKKDIPIDFIMGKFNPEVDSKFVEIPLKYASNKGMYMQAEAYEAFERMAVAAKKDKIDFKIVSAARNFFRQKSIWEAKWHGTRKVNGKDLSKSLPAAVPRALKILEYSSMPGTSRHHWGTDIDINNLENSYFEKGRGLKEYEWLTAHAEEYGFCQPYSPIGPERPKGYFEEKWHWSYMPLSKLLTDAAEANLKNEMITGFDGSETAVEIDVVKHFVLGINRACRH